jgi:hypothetical protein
MSSLKILPFYINIILLNKDEVIAAKVGGGKEKSSFFGKAASYAANKVIKDETVVAKISAGLVSNITEAVADMGIKVLMEVKFAKGPFVVIKAEVVEVDSHRLLLKTKGEEFGNSFKTLKQSMVNMGLQDKLPGIEEKVKEQVNEGFITKFNDILPTKLAEQGVLVEATVLHSQDQAEFFFDVVHKF